MNRSILLIGFMGAGKTTVSRALAGQAHLPELDTDQEIVRRAGMSIPEIFAREGEQAFRNRETDLLRELAAGDAMIISCGGGMAMREENAALMHQAGTVVLLSASPETILERVRDDDNRPLLRGHKDVPYIRQLMEARRPRYEAAADMTVVTDGRSAEDIAAEILGRLSSGTV